MERLSGRLVWFALGVVVATVTSTIALLAWLDARIDARIGTSDALRNQADVLKKQIDQLGASVPKGAVVAFDLSTGCPAGWSRVQDLNGRVIVGAGQGQPNLTPRDFRDRGGSETLNLTKAQLPKERIGFAYAEVNDAMRENRSSYHLVVSVGVAQANTRSADGPTIRFTEPLGEGAPVRIEVPFVALYFCRRD
jgi:hypothetical protein